MHRWSGRGLAGVLAGELLAALVELLRREAQAHHVLAAHLHSPCALTRTSRLALSLSLAVRLAGAEAAACGVLVHQGALPYAADQVPGEI